jgi:hypothetical protein
MSPRTRSRFSSSWRTTATSSTTTTGDRAHEVFAEDFVFDRSALGTWGGARRDRAAGRVTWRDARESAPRVGSTARVAREPARRLRRPGRTRAA